VSSATQSFFTWRLGRGCGLTCNCLDADSAARSGARRISRPQPPPTRARSGMQRREDGAVTPSGRGRRARSEGCRAPSGVVVSWPSGRKVGEGWPHSTLQRVENCDGRLAPWPVRLPSNKGGEDAACRRYMAGGDVGDRGSRT